MSIERVIGIDFGTSTSVVKIKTYKDNEPMEAREIADYVRFNNKDTLPTLVYKTDEENYFIGYEAENAAVKGQLYQNFKLDLISENEEVKNEAIFFTKIFFEHIYKVYDEQRLHFPSCDKETTYISYPAKWSDELRQLMIDIATQAGFKNTIGIDEPTAAIHTVMVQKTREFNTLCSSEANILMIDMGAGTTDIVLCNYDSDCDEKIRVLNTWPKNNDSCLFGGREIDEKLCNYVKNYLINCGLPNVKNFELKYLDKCKTWKEANISPIFKAEDGVVKYCGFIDALLSMLDVDEDFPPIARNDFENMLEGYINQFSKMINACIDDIGFNRENIDFVILTGGHSQWYFISDIIEAKLRKYGEVILSKIISDKNRIIHLSRPQETVALGMVYQKLNKEKIVFDYKDSDIMLLDESENIVKPDWKEDDTYNIKNAEEIYCGFSSVVRNIAKAIGYVNSKLKLGEDYMTLVVTESNHPYYPKNKLIVVKYNEIEEICFSENKEYEFINIKDKEYIFIINISDKNQRVNIMNFIKSRVPKTSIKSDEIKNSKSPVSKNTAISSNKTDKTTEKLLKEYKCMFSGKVNNVSAARVGLKAEASGFGVQGTLRLYEKYLSLDVDESKHPFYSKNKHIVIKYNEIREVKKTVLGSFTAEQTMTSVIPLVGVVHLGKSLASSSIKIVVGSIDYTVDLENEEKRKEVLSFISARKI